MKAAFGAFILLVLVACSAPSPSPSIGLPSASADRSQGLEAPDSSLPAAGICATFPGTVATFELNADTPNPRCGQVVGTQRLEVVNATSETVTVTFHGVAYVLKAGDRRTFQPTFG